MTLSCTIDNTGCYAPTYQEVIDKLLTEYIIIFGEDVYIDTDSMDYQLLALFALAINDSNNATVKTYNSFIPTYSTGTGLSNLVKINGIERLIPTYSTCNVTVIGVAGTEIINGKVVDKNGNVWSLEPMVTIPFSGEITVEVTCDTIGDVIAYPNDINEIKTVTLGWQTVNNETQSTTGNLVETDATLRKRQAISSTYPALSVTQSILASISNLLGVTKAKVYENDTDFIDDDGLPPHSIAAVVVGGDPIEIATTIAIKKTPGVYTYGNTTNLITVGNIPTPINFFVPTTRNLHVTLNIKALPGYTNTIGENIKNSLITYINNLELGDDVYITSLIAALCTHKEYHLISILSGLNNNPLTYSDKTVDFNEVVTLTNNNIILNVV